MNPHRIASISAGLFGFGTVSTEAAEGELLLAGIGGFSLLELGYAELLPVHVTAMSIAAAGVLTGGLIARYLKKRTKRWLKLHKAVQWSSAAIAAVGIGIGILMVENGTGRHFRVPHSFVALNSATLLASAIGFAYLFLKGRSHRKAYRTTHRWIGRVTIAAFLATIVFGLFAAGVL